MKKQCAEGQRIDQVRVVRRAVVELTQLNGRVSSVEEVFQQARRIGDVELTLKRVSKIMTGELGLKFKRMKTVAMRANCVSCLYQR